MTVEEILLACKEPLSVIKLLVVSGLAKSNTDARNKIKGRGVRIQDRLITDPFAVCYLIGSIVVICQNNNSDINIITGGGRG